jgi:hypothetical protein
MGLSLHGASGSLELSTDDWGQLLKLAILYGWKPMGTQVAPPLGDGTEQCVDPTTPESWDGRYWSGESQHVLGADASRLGSALERAMEDLPDEAPQEGETDLPLDYFGGSRKRLVQQCIDLCRSGGFRIE